MFCTKACLQRESVILPEPNLIQIKGNETAQPPRAFLSIIRGEKIRGWGLQETPLKVTVQSQAHQKEKQALRFNYKIINVSPSQYR